MPQITSAVAEIVEATTEQITVAFPTYDSEAERHDLYRHTESMQGAPIRNGTKIAEDIDPSQDYVDDTVDPYEDYNYQLVSITVSPAGAPEFIITVKTDNAGISENNQFQFTGAEGEYDVEAEYLDGVADVMNFNGLENEETITLSDEGTWRLKVTPTGLTPFHRIAFADSGDRLKLLEVNNWGTHEWSTFSSALRGCTNLTVLPEEAIPNVGSEASFSSFLRDTTITQIPENIFDNCNNVVAFSFCFSGCNNLAEIPANLFKNCTSAVSFRETFRVCHNLTEIPEGLFDACTEAGSFKETFRNCSLNDGTIPIPNGLFDNCPKVDSFYGTFRENGAIGDMPPDLFKNNIRANTFYRLMLSSSMSSTSLSGMYINLANTIILAEIDEFNASPDSKYDPDYENSELGSGTTAVNRAILAESASVTVSNAMDTNANGVYSRTSASVYTNVNGYTFTRSTTTWTLRDDESVTLATGTALGITNEMPHSVQRLGNTWSGDESGINVELTGAGWHLVDGGVID